MAMTNPAKRYAQRSEERRIGPATIFVATVLLAFTALILATMTFPKDAALAVVSSIFFAVAALIALPAWRSGRPDEHALSYWDVAGALTLFGICAATLMDSDQLVRLIESQRHAN
jgi:hypothetical protein